jgi:hypothetical protein
MKSLTKAEKEMAESKRQFLEVYEKKAGNIRETCIAVRMPRSKYYVWRRNDPAFAQTVDDVLEGLKDFAESKLMVNISLGKEASIFFFLKCKAKDRGYIERVDINHSGRLSLEDVLAASWKAGQEPKALVEG